MKSPSFFALFSPWRCGGVRPAAVLALGLSLWGGLSLCPLRGQTTDLPGAAPEPIATPEATPAPAAAATPATVTPAAAAIPAAAPARTAAKAPKSAALGGFGDVGGGGSQGPIDISSSGNTTFGQTSAGRIATATGSVRIQTNDASIYCDRADYNVDTHEAELSGNVRIYRLDTSIVANHAIYNFDTKGVRALDFSGTRPPFAFNGVSGFSPGAGAEYNVRQGSFTTDDSSQPDYHLDAHRIRIYPDNRLIYVGATLFIGTTPVFYFPYFYQSLDQQSGFTISPGDSSEYGAYLLTGVTFPITEHLTGIARLDFRSMRGVGVGLNLEYKPNRKLPTPPNASGLPAFASDDNPAVAAAGSGQGSPENSPGSQTAARADGTDPTEPGYAATGESLSRQIHANETIRLQTYFTHDDDSDLNRTSLERLPIDSNRYRVKLTGTSFITDDLFFKVDADKISDRYLIQDFYEGEFNRDPNPDNVIFATFYQPTFIATLTLRGQLNPFFDTTERLPELALDVPRLSLWKSGFFYEGEDTVGYLKRTFDNQSSLPEYDALRIDTFHQVTFPKTLFGWLSVVPRVGLRATYYSHSAPANDAANGLQTISDSPVTGSLIDAGDITDGDYLGLRNAIKAFKPRGDIIRPVVDAGLEVSFKLSRVYDDVESRTLGLDELQHVIQPYANFLEVEDFGVPSRQLLQFDRRVPSTQLQPIDFPQQTAIDSIDNETVVRMGVRNRLQTKRDALTFDWLEVDTFFQIGNDPNQRSNISDVFNQLTFRPVPWFTATVDSQLPIFNQHSGFTEVDSALSFQATRNLDISISHRYLDNNPFFVNSSLLRLNVYYRLDDNWAASFSERYEFANGVLQAQSYTIYRDLTSFVGSLGLTVRDNNGVTDIGIALNFTLKGIPRVSLPAGFNVDSVSDQASQ